jgi:hypothetical protein
LICSFAEPVFLGPLCHQTRRKKALWFDFEVDGFVGFDVGFPVVVGFVLLLLVGLVTCLIFDLSDSKNKKIKKKIKNTQVDSSPNKK